MIDNKKANIPAIAIAILALLFFVIVITVIPELKETVMTILDTISG